MGKLTAALAIHPCPAPGSDTSAARTALASLSAAKASGAMQNGNRASCLGENPSPQPPPRNGEGEQAKQPLFFSPSPGRGGGWGGVLAQTRSAVAVLHCPARLRCGQ